MKLNLITLIIAVLASALAITTCNNLRTPVNTDIRTVHTKWCYEYNDSTTYTERIVDTTFVFDISKFTLTRSTGAIDNNPNIKHYNRDSVEVITWKGEIDRIFVTHINSLLHESGIGYIVRN